MWRPLLGGRPSRPVRLGRLRAFLPPRRVNLHSGLASNSFFRAGHAVRETHCAAIDDHLEVQGQRVSVRALAVMSWRRSPRHARNDSEPDRDGQLRRSCHRRRGRPREDSSPGQPISLATARDAEFVDHAEGLAGGSKGLAGPTGFEPAISSVTGWHVGPLHHGPAGVTVAEHSTRRRPLQSPAPARSSATSRAVARA